jgi:CheY-like chemotaxis protein
MSSSTTYRKPLGGGQVASICRVSKKTVLNWIYEGALKAFTTYGGHYRVWPVNLKKFLDASGMDIPFDYVDETATRILIIDDEKPFAQMVKSVISAELPTVDIAATDDPYEGLLMIGEQKPHLIILDVRIPKVDGLQVLELLQKRKAQSGTKILVVSNHINGDTKAKLLRSAADAVLDKQVDVGLLVKTVGALIRSDAPVQEQELVR